MKKKIAFLLSLTIIITVSLNSQNIFSKHTIKKVIEKNNAFGGVTVLTDYKSERDYHHGERVSQKTEFFDSDSILIYAEFLYRDAKTSKEYYYTSGDLKKASWFSRGDHPINIEYFLKGNILDKIDWIDKEGNWLSREYFGNPKILLKKDWMQPDSTKKKTVYYKADSSIEKIEFFKNNFHTQTFHYNLEERIVKEDNFDENQNPTVSFYYDKKKRLTRKDLYLPRGKRAIEFYSKNKLIKEEFYNKKGWLIKAVSYNNSVKTKIDIYKTRNAKSTLTTILYDAQGNITSKKIKDIPQPLTWEKNNEQLD